MIISALDFGQFADSPSEGTTICLQSGIHVLSTIMALRGEVLFYELPDADLL